MQQQSQRELEEELIPAKIAQIAAAAEASAAAALEAQAASDANIISPVEGEITVSDLLGVK